jgi:UDP-N-acetylmuramate dehydrogenase
MVLEQSQCGFTFRSSRFLGSGEVILGVTLSLDESSPKEVRRLTLEILRKRRGKFPRKEATCGSVFKSSNAMWQAIGPPGKVIELAGLKGLKWGGLEISALHGNFFINRGGATAKDAFGLIHHVRTVVRQRFHWDLESEVMFVDRMGHVLPVTDVD